MVMCGDRSYQCAQSYALSLGGVRQELDWYRLGILDVTTCVNCYYQCVCPLACLQLGG